MPVPPESIFERYLGFLDFGACSTHQNRWCDSRKVRQTLRCALSPISTLPVGTSRSPSIGTISSNDARSDWSLPYSPCFKREDHIAPVLDLTAELFADPNADLDNVRVVYCDVIGCHSQRRSSCPAQTHSSSGKCQSSLKNSLRRAFSSSAKPLAKSATSRTTSLKPERDSMPVVNFYSFADSVKSENVSVRFNSHKMSDVLHCINFAEDEHDVSSCNSTMRSI